MHALGVGEGRASSSSENLRYFSQLKSSAAAELSSIESLALRPQRSVYSATVTALNASALIPSGSQSHCQYVVVR